MSNRPSAETVLSIWNPSGNLWAAEYVPDKKDFYLICRNKFKKTAGCRIVSGAKSPCKDCTSKNYVVLIDEWMRKHLSGEARIGIYALPPGGDAIYWCAGDLDGHKEGQDPHSDVGKLIEICAALDIPLRIFSSNSGNGYHAYLFFSSPVPAYKARALMLTLLERAGMDTPNQKQVLSMRYPQSRTL